MLTGVIYPLAVWGVGQVAFHHQANGSFVKPSTARSSAPPCIGQNFLDKQGQPAAPVLPAPPVRRRRPATTANASGGSNLGPERPPPGRFIPGLNTVGPERQPVDDQPVRHRRRPVLRPDRRPRRRSPVTSPQRGQEYEKNQDGSYVCDPTPCPQRVIAYRQLNGLAAGASVPVDAVTASGSGLDPDISEANALDQAARVAKARHLPADHGDRPGHQATPTTGPAGRPRREDGQRARPQPGPRPPAPRREEARTWRGGSCASTWGRPPAWARPTPCSTRAGGATSRGTDVVVGFVETHGRARTEAQIGDLEVVPRRPSSPTGTRSSRRWTSTPSSPAARPWPWSTSWPTPTSRAAGHAKRWQDVEDLLDAGIDVISTVNIQHLESASTTSSSASPASPSARPSPTRWCGPADQIELVDMSPEALRRRMAHGNIYAAEKVDAALANYFRRRQPGRPPGAGPALGRRPGRGLAPAVPGGPRHHRAVGDQGARRGGHHRRARRRAPHPAGRAAWRSGSTASSSASTSGRSTPSVTHPPHGLAGQRSLLDELGGRYAEVIGADVSEALVSFARAENATQLVLGASGRSRWAEIVHGSVINQVIRDARPIDVHVISPPELPATGLPASPRRRRPTAVPPRRRQLAWVLGTVGIIALGAALSPLRSSLELPGALLCLLLGVIAVAAVGGIPPAAVAAVTATLAGDFFFTTPYYTLRMNRAAQIVDVLVFFVAAAVVSALIDRLARRGLQVARAQAEAEALARLAGGSVLAGVNALPDLVAELRRTFDLDGVAIFAPDVDGAWTVAAGAGSPLPDRPEQAPFSAELDDGAVLVLVGSNLSAEDTRLLGAFVAQLRQAQEHLRLEAEAANAAELAEANSLRGALLAAVSHDLRTPLASIKAAATSLLSSEVNWDHDQAEGFAKTINAESDRLDPARVQPAGHEPAPGRSGAHNHANRQRRRRRLPGRGEPRCRRRRCGHRHRRGPASGVRRPGSPGTGAGQRHRQRGHLVAARSSRSGRSRHQRRARRHPHHRRGPGIPPDQRDQVFQPFQRLGDRAGGSPSGLGLGLAVARGFTRAIGGELSFEDTPGGGATFTFSLPRAGK